ncbi:MAG: hypothetical protein ACRD96_06545, partial [Bryobacteraceae bacterium]
YLIKKNAGPFFASRSEEIRQGIDEARKMKADAEARAAAIDARMKGLSADIESLRQTAREETAAEGRRIRRETERELAKIHAHTEQEIVSLTKAARMELKRHAAGLAVGLARQKVAQRITPAHEEALVRAFAVEIGRSRS